MLIIAHRGASKDALENTLSAFDLAWQQEADGIELDVHLARCGTPVVIHDATLERTAGLAQAVCSLTAHELAAYQIPTLAEILTRYAGKGLLFVEIKAPAAALPAAHLMEAAIRAKTWPREQLVMIGFDHACLLAAREAYPGIVLGLSCDLPLPETIWLPIRHDLITPQMVEQTRAEEIPLIAWTVNNAEDARRLRALGVAALITDQPHAAREWVRGD